MKYTLSCLSILLTTLLCNNTIAGELGKTQDMIIEENRLAEQNAARDKEMAIANNRANGGRNYEAEVDRRSQAIIENNQNRAAQINKENKSTERATTSIFGPGTLTDQKVIDEENRKKIKHMDEYDFSTNQERTKQIRENHGQKELSNPALQ